MSKHPFDSDRPASSQPGELVTGGRVLVVDDADEMRRVLTSILERYDFEVLSAPDGVQACTLLNEEQLDVVVSDIRMPNMDGVALLKAAKEIDPDLPVILVTGAPELDSAIQAVELGAFHYLTKPFKTETLINIVERAFRISRLARMRRQAAWLTGVGASFDERTELQNRFERVLEGMQVAYQPLVDVTLQQVFGYEALMRSNISELAKPPAMLEIAEQLGCLHELGRAVRRAVTDSVPPPRSGHTLFVNVHPQELADDELADPNSPLAAHASRVVLEVTEHASLDNVSRLADRITRLRALGYRIAVDDLGAGYASLNSFAQLQPDFVKLDMALVQQAPADPMRRRLIRSMIRLCEDMGIDVVGEGVETAKQRDTLQNLGCDIMQGFFFARPGPAFPEVSW